MGYIKEHWGYLTGVGGYPGVDFLRALAVLLVVFYHFQLFPIGWIGVDIFFVLSGFLIGGVILDKIRVGRFDFFEFYKKRALRILPIYYFIMLLCFIFKRTLTPDGATSYGEIVVDQSISSYLLDIGNALIEEGLDFGHFNVQLIQTENGPVLFEINGRLSSTEASKAYYGYNSCAAFVYNVVKQQPFDGWNIAQSGRFLRYYEELYFK